VDKDSYSEISWDKTKKNLASIIDHTNLHPDATNKDIEQLCKEAIEWGTAAVCVAPYYVEKCKNILAKTDIKVCTVIGFPLGANKTEVKTLEAKESLKDGADELDMVINIGALKSSDYTPVFQDIKQIAELAEDNILKVILETALLTDKEIIRACEIAEEAGADFVKTSTGFAKEGATVKNVKLMRNTVGSRLGVKAAGGIKTYEQAQKMVEAGANRIGASSSGQIIMGSHPDTP
jgi:deoxyribose-phosphate aldolase